MINMQMISAAEEIYAMFEEANRIRNEAFSAYMESIKGEDRKDFHLKRTAWLRADSRADGLWAAYYHLARI